MIEVKPARDAWLVCALCVACTLCAWRPAAAQDWPQWRGPARDGQVPHYTPPAAWPPALEKLWQVEVGLGHSSPLVLGQRVFQFARQGEEETVLCLELETGREVWRQSYPAPYEVNSVAAEHGAGPKSTPAAAGGRLVTLGISGILTAWDGGSGKRLWQKEFSGQFPATSPLYGTAMSPLIDDKLCIAHVGGHDRGLLAAFDLETGAVRWRSLEHGPAYASPILATLNKTRQLVVQTQTACAAVAAETGKVLWQVPFTTEYDQNSVTPLVANDLVIFGGYNQATFALRPSRRGGRWMTSTVWENGEDPFFMNTPVLCGGLLYGMTQRNSGQLVALDPADGRVRWRGEPRLGENAALLAAGRLLFVLSTEGTLFVLDTADGARAEAARYRVADTPTWAHPALAGGRLLVKDEASLACYKLP